MKQIAEWRARFDVSCIFLQTPFWTWGQFNSTLLNFSFGHKEVKADGDEYSCMWMKCLGLHSEPFKWLPFKSTSAPVWKAGQPSLEWLENDYLEHTLPLLLASYPKRPHAACSVARVPCNFSVALTFLFLLFYCAAEESLKTLLPALWTSIFAGERIYW